MTDGDGQSLTLTSPSTFSTYTLAPGETEDIQATYTIEQSAADTGSISNTVSVDGTAPDGTEVSDDLDAPVVVSTDLTPSIEVTKTSTITYADSDAGVQLGDTINYTITVENTGNTTLTGVTVSDTILDSAGVSLTLTTGPTYGGTGTFDGILDVGESVTYDATFVITQQAVNAGGVSNTASVTSKDPSGTDVTDSTDSATEDLIPRTAEMSVVKTASVDDNGDNKYGVGDVIQYTVTVTNTGNVTLTDVDLSDELRLGSSTANVEDNTGNDSPAGVNLWTQDQTLLPGESATYVAWYIIDDTAASSGKVINTAIATADTPLTSADGSNQTLSVTSNEAVVDIAPIPSISITKTSEIVQNDTGNTTIDVGDQITYTIVVTNDGNTALTGVDITDTLTAIGGASLSLDAAPVFVSSTDANTTFTNDTSTSVPTLLVGEAVTFSATYTVAQAAIDAGGVSNTASVVGYDPDGEAVNGSIDSAVVNNITQTPSIEVTKVAVVDHVTGTDSETTTGDTIVYTITIANTGNVTLTGIDITDTMTDGDGQSLTLTSPSTFSTYTLAPGETEDIQATYTIEQSAADTGSISNTVSVDGTAPDGTEVSDDLDAPVVVSTDLTPSIEVTKTSTITYADSDAGVQLGDTINYTITVENTGNTTLTGVTVSDTILDSAGVSLTLTTGPTYGGTGTFDGILDVGESVTYDATFVITQQAVNAGGVSNTASVTSKDPSGTDVTDSTDSATEDLIPRTAEMSVVKTASVDDNGDNKYGVGDVIQYTVTVTNTGNVTLTDVDLSDELRLGSSTANVEDNTGNDSPAGVNLWTQDQTLLPGESATYVAWYIIDDTAASSGKVINTAIATADTPLTSADGSNQTLSVTSNEAVVDIAPIPSISITKTSEIVQNDTGNTTIDVGDQITYTIVVTNDGNTALTGVDITDTLTAIGGASLSLDAAPVFVSSTDANTTFTNDTSTSVPTLLVGEAVTFSATYTVAQAAIDAGGVSNTASVVGYDPDGEAVNGSIDSAVVNNITQTPSIEVTKVAVVDHVTGTDSETTTGDTIVYTITIANTGNVTLTGIDITDTMTDGDGQSLTLTSPSTFSTYTLAPGETEDIQATYTIEQSAADTGSISNTVSVDGTAPDGTEVSDDLDTPVVVSTDLTPSIEVTKTSTITYADSDAGVQLGDTINYTITVENTGNTTLTGVTVSDTILDSAGVSLTLTTGPTYGGTGTFDGILDVGESVTYDATFVITQQAVNAGGVSNTASVTSKDPSGTDVTDSTDSATEDLIPRTAEMSVVKTASVDDNGDNKYGVGDVIQYTVTVTNTGNVTLTDVDLSDELRLGSSTANVEDNTGNDSPAGVNLWTQDQTLLPGESATYVAWYIIDDTAASSGKVINTAIATADTPLTSADGSNQTLSVTSNEAVVDIAPIPSISITKTSEIVQNDTGNTTIDVGDQITYTIVVTNDGNTALTGVDITDTLTTIGGASLSLDAAPVFVSSTDANTTFTNDTSTSVPTLLVGEAVTFSATYTVAQAAIDAGGVSNTASVVGYDPDGEAVNGSIDSAVVNNITQTPSIEVTKVAVVDHVTGTDSETTTGDTIVYTITIANTGNVTLTGIDITDTMTDGDGQSLTLTSPSTFSTYTLAPGETEDIQATYTIEQSAADTGSISNTVSVDGTAPDGTEVSDDLDTPVVVSTDLTPSIEVTKTSTITYADSDAGVQLGDTINYTITVENTGNTTLTGVTVSDTILDSAGVSLTLTTGPTYGGTGTFDGILDVGESVTYDATFVITQQAVNAGGVSNTASVTSKDPSGTDVTDSTDSATEDLIPRTAEMSVVKTASVDDNGDNKYGVGDVIQYTVTVTNTGNVTLTDVDLSDELRLGSSTANVEDNTGNDSPAGVNLWTQDQTLLPGESATYVAWYIIDDTAASSGKVINTAIATADTPLTSADGSNQTLSVTSNEAVVDIAPIPSISITKTSEIVQNDTGNTTIDVGDEITYTIVVTNDGNTALTGVDITDTLTAIGGASLSLDAAPVFVSSTDANTTFTNDTSTSVPTLLVGEAVTFSATYTVAQAAIDAGGVSNTASVVGYDPDGEAVNGSIDSAVVNNITQTPSIEVTKVAVVDHVTGTDSETTTGDTIVYTITIANTGNVTLTGIDITDTMTDGDGQSLTLTSPSTFSTYTLAPGETEDIQATYTIEQSAADTGSISNTVSVDGTAPDGTEVSDDLDTPVVVSTDLTPSIEVTKTSTITYADSDAGVQLGDTINYTITVENTGNTTLTGVTVSDTILDSAGVSLTLTTGPTYGGTGTFDGILDVGESVTYDATFVITQQAVNAGGVSNTASVTSKDPSGTDVTDSTDSATEDLIPRTAEMSVVKTASVDDNGDNKNGVGDVIQYTVTVTNTGNVTLTDVDLSDELRLGSSTANVEDNTGNDSPAGVNLWTQDQTLLPGESATYVAWYIIDDTAASSGKVINTAIATADTPLTSADGSNQTLSVTSNEAVVDIAPIPSISITKTSEIVQNDTGNTTIDVGDEITYTIVVTNDGNTALTGVDITDTLTAIGGASLSLDAAPVFVSSTDANTTFTNDTSTSVPTLLVGEAVTFSATYTVAQAAIDAGGVSNTASVVGYDPDGEAVNGSIDSAVVNNITQTPAITVTKTASVTHVGDADAADRVVRADDIIDYTITITNTGNVTLTDLAVVDALTDGAGNDLVMTSDPTNQWTIASLAPGAVQTYTPYYTIGSPAALTGSISNVVTVTGDTPNGTDDITAISDDPNDTTSNQDPTVVETDLFASIKVTKQDKLIDDGDTEAGAGD